MSTYTLTRWSLVDLFPGHDSPELEAAFNELDTMVAAFEESRSKLAVGIPAGEFMDLIHQMDAITTLIYRVYVFAGLWFTEDTQDQNAQALIAKVDQFTAGLQNRLLFFELWWKSLEDDEAKRLMDAADAFYISLGSESM